MTFGTASILPSLPSAVCSRSLLFQREHHILDTKFEETVRHALSFGYALVLVAAPPTECGGLGLGHDEGA